MTPLPTLGGYNGFATGVNNHGQVVGWAETPVHDPTCNAPQVLQFRAVMWEPKKGTATQLPPLHGDSTSAATAINDRGQAVGISGACDVAVGEFSAAHAVLWDHGTVTDIGNLGGVAWNTPMAINESGVVVGFSDPPGDADGSFNARAFRWTRQTGMDSLPMLPGDAFSEALGVNGRGQVVGISFGGAAGSRAFIWQDGKTIDLNTLMIPGFPDHLIAAQDINDAGHITGRLLEKSTGKTLAFVATPIVSNP
jgi:probable HAF family extracellular repeat protein